MIHDIRHPRDPAYRHSVDIQLPYGLLVLLGQPLGRSVPEPTTAETDMGAIEVRVLAFVFVFVKADNIRGPCLCPSNHCVAVFPVVLPLRFSGCFGLVVLPKVLSAGNVPFLPINP